MIKLRYKIVVEGEYEVDPLDYDTVDADEIAEADRAFAKEDVAEFISSLAAPGNFTGVSIEPTEIIILPM